jgi:hypothetical protein
VYHLLAFTALDTAAAVNETVPSIVDGWATPQGTAYVLQQDAFLVGAYAQNAGALNARVNTPHYRFVSIPSIQPVNAAAAPGDYPPYADLRNRKLTIPRIDPLTAELTNGGAGGVRSVVGLWVSDGNMNAQDGDVYTIRGTGTITAVVGAWTLGSFTLDQQLPAGTYMIIGMDVIGTNLVFARLQFTGGAGAGGMRPGVICRQAVGDTSWPDHWRNGNFGNFGTFANTAQPNLEIFATGANSAQTVFLDVIRISGR